MGPATALSAVRAEARIDAEGVTEEVVTRQTLDGDPAPATLLLPPSFDPGSSHPAVLLLHGHAAGASGWLDEAAPTERGLGRILARAGFVVFAPDQRSFGGFLPGGLDHEAYTRALEREGEVYVRRAAQDARASLAWLAAQPGVDPGRLGVLGQSMGGFVALLLALAEPDVRAVTVSGIFMPFADLFSDANHACQHFDALRDVGESAALGAALAPTALQVHFGADDAEFVEANHGRDNSLDLLDRWWTAPRAPMPSSWSPLASATRWTPPPTSPSSRITSELRAIGEVDAT